MSAPPFDLSGKTALVTGSTRGIGLALARALAAAGARVAINGRTADAVDAVVARIEVAQQTVLHTDVYPSHVVLPVVG